MKTLIFLSGLLFVLSSFAFERAESLEATEISGFSGSYSQGQGNASASVWNLPKRPAESNVSFQVFKESTQFRLIAGAEEYIFEDVPQALLDLEEASWSNLNAKTGGDKVSLSLSELRGSGQGSSLLLNTLKGDCQGGQSANDFLMALVESCSTNGNLSFRELVSASTVRSQNKLLEFFRSILGVRGGTRGASSLNLENFNLNVKNKKFTLSVKAHLDISATVKAEGSFQYTQNSVRIKIDKVKASFLNITNKVFDELDKIQNPNVVVSRPYVTISF